MNILNLTHLALIILILFISNQRSFAQLKINNKAAFIKADLIEYDALGDYIYAQGNIKILTEEHIITANRVIYDLAKDLLIAQNEVKIIDKKNQVIYGETVYFKDQLKKGIIKNFIVKFPDNSILISKLAKRLNENKANLCNTDFTPCKVDNNKIPIWQISAVNTDLDFVKEKVIYNNVFFKVYGVPVFYTPYFAHPLPNAKAQSGLLVPTIGKNTFNIPVYFRLSDNVDATITPRIAEKYLIYQGEFRHKTANGQYSVDGSYGKVPYFLKNNEGNLIKKTRVNSFHLFARGKFSQNNYHYGFDLNKTSDKAYLKNYYNLYDSYLVSKIYLNNVDNYNYLQLASLSFQGLRAEDNSGHDPLILPKIKTKNVFNLDEAETTDLIVDNDTLIYHEPKGKQLGRESLQLSVAKQYIARSGYLFDVQGSYRNNIYFVNQLSSMDVRSSDQLKAKTVKMHNIPELKFSWHYPLIGTLGDDMNISIEPIIISTIGLNFKKSYNNYALVDAGRFEPSENNLFASNHFAGVDYHEYGKRAAYGLNSSLLIGDKYVNLFIGQLHYKRNNIAANSTGEIVGKIAINFADNLSLFHRFRKNKEYQPIRDELGFSYYNDKTKFSFSYIKLQNLKKYYSNKEMFNFNSDHIKQAYYNFEYQLTSDLTIGNEMRFDLTNKKIPLLYRTIKMTYVHDCVSIGVEFYDGYMSDSIRGIKKSHTNNISVGLKVLNM